jgi:hypothetical protein
VDCAVISLFPPVKFWLRGKLIRNIFHRPQFSVSAEKTESGDAWVHIVHTCCHRSGYCTGCDRASGWARSGYRRMAGDRGRKWDESGCRSHSQGRSIAAAIGEWTAHVAAARTGSNDWVRAGLQFTVGQLTGEFCGSLRCLTNYLLERRRKSGRRAMELVVPIDVDRPPLIEKGV